MISYISGMISNSSHRLVLFIFANDTFTKILTLSRALTRFVEGWQTYTTCDTLKHWHNFDTLKHWQEFWHMQNMHVHAYYAYLCLFSKFYSTAGAVESLIRDQFSVRQNISDGLSQHRLFCDHHHRAHFQQKKPNAQKNFQ